MSRSRAWGLVLVATLVMTISYVDRQALAALAEIVCEDLHIGEVAYGLLGSAFSIAYLVGAPAAGFLLDRLGVRRGLTVSVLAWSGVAALHALTPGIGTLFALRIALGVAESPSFPGATQVVHRVLPPEERGRGVGVLFTGSSLGALIAPRVCLSIYRATLSWQMAFLGASAIGLLWLPLWLFATRGDDVRALLAAPRERDPEQPRVKDVVFHPAVLRAAAAIVATAPTMAFLLIFGGKWLVLSAHVPKEHVDSYLWLPPLLFDLGAVGFGFLVARFRRAQAPGDHRAPRLWVAIACVLGTATFFAARTSDPWTGTILGGIAAAGVGGVFASAMADMLGRLPRPAIGLAAGVCAAAQSVAYIVASNLVGASVAATHAYTDALNGLAIWSIPGVVVWLVVRPAPRVE